MALFSCTDNGFNQNQVPSCAANGRKSTSMQSGNYQTKHSQCCISLTIQVTNTKTGKSHQHMWKYEYVKLHQHVMRNSRPPVLE